MAKAKPIAPFAGVEALSFEGSSHLHSGAYDHQTGLLMIRFWEGSSYHYFGVPKEVAKALKQAASAGKYFWANIRGGYGETKVG